MVLHMLRHVIEIYAVIGAIGCAVFVTIGYRLGE